MAGGVYIDGALGEGGGQILRTSLTASILTGRPVRVEGIRSKRSRAGLAAQHLAAVRVAAACCGGRVNGAVKGSTELLFEPGKVVAGKYGVEIGTAGSTSLVLQTVALPLGLAEGASRIAIAGGTHVPWSPCWDFIDADWTTTMRAIGLPVKVRLQRSGYFPEGGGTILALIPGGARVRPLTARLRGNLRMIRGRAFYSHLTRNVGEAIVREARRHLRRAGVAVNVEPEERDGGGPGSGLFLEAVTDDDRTVGFAALGAKQKPSERVAREAVNSLFRWLDTGAAIGRHLADQILLPLAVADGTSEFETSEITSHLLTNAEVIRRFHLARIGVEGKIGERGLVRVEPLKQAH